MSGDQVGDPGGEHGRQQVAIRLRLPQEDVGADHAEHGVAELPGGQPDQRRRVHQRFAGAPAGQGQLRGPLDLRRFLPERDKPGRHSSQLDAGVL